MTISSLSSTDYYSATTSPTKTNKSGTSNPLDNTLTTLENDLESGDTTDASNVLTNMLANARGSSSSSSSGAGNQITSYLKSLESAVASGDTTTAKGVLTKLNDYLAANPPPQPPTTANSASTSGNPLQTALATIDTDLQSGDTADASSLLTNILANTQGSSASASSSSTSSISGSSSVSNPITSYLKSLESAVATGDTTTAEGVLTKLNDYLAANPPPQPTGSGTYSSDGTVTSNPSSSTSALSALV